jgi:ubiquinone/menaquinone biosynthesis C-methylase UbiE
MMVAMGLYNRFVLPWVIHLAMQTADTTRLRGRVIPEARGRVLEIGIGSGLNLPFYGDGVENVTGIDTSPGLLALAEKRARETPFMVHLRGDDAEKMRFDDASFDTVVSTWTLCSIPDLAAALREIRRVLRPDGRFLFVEHGRSPEPGISAWQDRLTPIWRRCAGGCHLNRDIAALIEGGGFRLGNVDIGYLVHGPRVLTWNTRGRAVPF